MQLKLLYIDAISAKDIVLSVRPAVVTRYMLKATGVNLAIVSNTFRWYTGDSRRIAERTVDDRAYATAAPPEPSEADCDKKSSKRISILNACDECRRRKIRCDGDKPCGQCGWYQHPQRCVYSKPTQRVIPSRKALDKLQRDSDHHRPIVSRVFPGQKLETLAGLPREQLVDLAVTLPAPQVSPSHQIDQSRCIRETARARPPIDEAKRHRHKVNAISDDVKGLFLSMQKQSSYVGIYSVSAALRVILKIAPFVRTHIARTYNETVPPSRSTSPPPNFRPMDPYYLPSPDVGQKLIESYFRHVDVQMPMIDEDHLWRTYLYDHRRDSPWLALLNMVMALASLASSTCEDEEHYVYFQRARLHLDLETFGSSSILMLQAMGLFSGYYLHYLNRPNEASCLMGVILRMATALGLHHEYEDGLSSRSASQGVRPEIRNFPLKSGEEHDGAYSA
ncbi:hypothetical protein LTR49_027417 [Elasticomyces elasticus]|nr:hypothetical protein LTR49_027417 [Elasticomyces elasticus]